MTRENFRAVGTGAARHAGSAAVDVVCSRDFKVAAFNVSSTQPVPSLGRPRTVVLPSNPLASSNTADFRIFEWSQNPRHKSRGPSHIVVRHDSDGRLNLGEGLAHLKALVRDGGVQNSNFGKDQRVSQLLKLLSLVMRSDQDKLSRLTSQNTLQRRAKLLKSVMDSGDDNSNVLASEGRFAGNGL